MMYWKIFTEVSTPDKANKVMGWVTNKLSIQHQGWQVEPYSKGGFVCTFRLTPNGETWPDVVVESFSLAQNLGRGWLLSGDIKNEIDAWSNDSSVSGVRNIHLVIENA